MFVTQAAVKRKQKSLSREQQTALMKHMLPSLILPHRSSQV